MLSYIKSFYYYFFPDNTSTDESDHDNEEYLAEQIFNLELDEEKNDEVLPSEPQMPKDAVCYERTGVITIAEENYVLIDGSIYFDTTNCNLNLQPKDKVLYLCYKDVNSSIVVVRLLQNDGIYWGDDEDAVTESCYNIIEHVVVGEVDYRDGRMVFIKNGNLKFDLDNVTATFVPIQGDWLELLCKVKFDDGKPMNISFDMIIEVLSFKAVRCKVTSAVIREWDGDTGTCDKQIFFDKHCVVNNIQPAVGSKVLIEMIESNQGTCTWRVIKMHITEVVTSNTNTTIVDDTEDKRLDIENKYNLQITFPIKFEEVHLNENPSITLNITNYGDQRIVFNKWIMLCRKRDSQVNISPFLYKPCLIHPKSTFTLTVTCLPKFFGRSKERLILMFKGFQVERSIEVNVITDSIIRNAHNDSSLGPDCKTEVERITLMKDIRKDKDKPFVQGMRHIRTPNFVAVRLGVFPIPDRIWSAVLGDSNETIYHLDYEKIISRIESYLPCLIQTLNITNYTDRWHTLTYMEEIQATINMRNYDMQRVFLIKCQEFLGIEVKGLAEKRPSILIGDAVLVTDTWDNSRPSHEGIVHLIKGELVLLKFHPRFHEDYTGSDVSVQFRVGRSVYRRAHQAINLAISNLGVDILFPSRVKRRPSQIPHEKLDTIEWFNTNLNNGQKAAVKNILLGECRPMPYCIYGPPGTGKTITVVETILQILNNFPDSRILVATPSNSAANLVTERLLYYKKYFSNSIIRLIANHLIDSENIPDMIKPYCASINIAKEDSVKSTHTVKNGMNLNVHASYIARYRVNIGTCFCIGTLAQLGLPKGHYTHVIIDEAGQALEPEIMIPLTFIDKENGQIVLAGDPMQLGPVVMSRYCVEYGYDESYMSRILETFPYQKDYHAFESGFNEKLVTKLTDNYRSLEEVITLPSQMFYDSALVPKLNSNMPWIGRMLNILSVVFESANVTNQGGIFVYGIKGCNTKAEDCPSWFNPQEASMIALTTCKLLKNNVTCDEIGIIAPYIAQIKYIRLLFDAMGLPQPKIGTIEEFQGQERPIILISTVRTTQSETFIDQKHALGFVKNPKRLNVAITRGQVAVILFCDPHLLLCDPLWQKVINYSIKNEKYMGCDLPFENVNRCISLE